MTETWHMGTHLRVLAESYPMNTNMTGFRWFSKNICILVLWTKVASALEGLKLTLLCKIIHQSVVRPCVLSRQRGLILKYRHSIPAHQSTRRQPVSCCTNTKGYHVKNMPSTSMTYVACKLKLR